MSQDTEIFISYAHEDEEHRMTLEKYLKHFQRERLIRIWYDRNISAGTEWERQIDQHLTTAEIFLLLISPDFLSSDYCHSVEMKRALERHEQGEACAIPIILRPVDWRTGLLGRLQALPKDARPVTQWTDRDLAWLDIYLGLQRVIAEIQVNEQGNLRRILSPIPITQTKLPSLLGSARGEVIDERWMVVPYEETALNSFVQALNSKKIYDSDLQKMVHAMNTFIQEELEFFEQLENQRKALDAYDKVTKFLEDNPYASGAKSELLTGKITFLQFLKQKKD